VSSLTGKEDWNSSNELDKMTRSQWRECVDTSKWQRDKSHFPHSKATCDERLPPVTNIYQEIKSKFIV